MNKHDFRRLAQCATGFLLLFFSSAYCAPRAESGGIRLNQTRIIFNAGDKMQTLTVKNRSDTAWLIQSRALMTTETNSPAPFIATPPLFRLESGTEQTLRILPQNAPMPQDKESLFYLALQAIPASPPHDPTEQQMAMSMRFNLKMFYRPASLRTPPADNSCQLRFTRGGKHMRVENPTPWFITLRSLAFDQRNVDLTKQPLMLAPGSTQNVPGSAQQVSWQAVNDFGSVHPACRATVTPTRS